MSIWVMEYRDIDYVFEFKTVAIWIIEITQAMNTMITLVSWGYILPSFWKSIGFSTLSDIWYQIYQIIIHTLPIINSSINLYILSDVIIYVQDLWLMPFSAFFYCIATYFITEYSGTIIYPWLTWEDYNTYITIFVAVNTAIFIHLGDAWIS